MVGKEWWKGKVEIEDGGYGMVVRNGRKRGWWVRNGGKEW